MNDRSSPSPASLRRRGLAAAALILLAALPLLTATEIENTIRDFKATLQRHPNGRVKTMLTADYAELPPDGTIHGLNVRVLMCDDAGGLLGDLSTEDIVVDRTQQIGHCTGRTTFERRLPDRKHKGHPADSASEESSISISGDAVEWRGADSLLVITSNAVVTLYRGGKTIAEGWK